MAKHLVRRGDYMSRDWEPNTNYQPGDRVQYIKDGEPRIFRCKKRNRNKIFREHNWCDTGFKTYWHMPPFDRATGFYGKSTKHNEIIRVKKKYGIKTKEKRMVAESADMNLWTGRLENITIHYEK